MEVAFSLSMCSWAVVLSFFLRCATNKIAPKSAPIPTRIPNASPALAPPDMPLDAASAEEVADGAVDDIEAATTEPVTEVKEDMAATTGEDEVSIFSVDCAWVVIGREVASELWLSLFLEGVGVAFVSFSSSSLSFEFVGRGRTAGSPRVLVCWVPPPTALFGWSSSVTVTKATN